MANRSFAGQIWSGIEGLVRRGSSSLIALALAVISDPARVGFYSASFVVLTIYQGWFEGPLRQTAQRIYSDAAGREYLRRIALYGGLIGAIVVALLVFVIGVVFDSSALDVAAMMFIGLVPVISSRLVMSTIEMQRQGAWKALARYRSVSAVLALIFSVPTLLLTETLWAVPLHVIVSEAVPLFLMRHVKTVCTDQPTPSDLEFSVYLWQSIFPQILAWCRVQADRVVLMVLAAATTLGLYSLAMSVARLPLDAILQGFVNHLRTELSTIERAQESPRIVLSRFQQRGAILAFVYSLFLMIIGVPLLILTLGEQWKPVAPVVFVLAVSSVVQVHSTGLLNTLIHFGFHKRVYPAQTVGLVLAVLGGWVMSFDIVLGAWLFTSREIIISIMLSLAGRKFIDRRGIYSIAAGTILLGSLAFYLS